MDTGGLIAARLLSYSALLLVAGMPIYVMCAGGGATVSRRLRLGLAALAGVALFASIWWALASVATMTALPLADLDRTTATAVLAATPLGRVLEIRVVALLGVIAAVLVPLPRGRMPLAALFAVVALAAAAWTGHSGASEGTAGTLHRVADVLHLIAAATWLGALVLLLAAVFTRAGDLDRRLSGFATVGSVIVATLLLTGIYNTLAISGFRYDPALLTSRWGMLLAIKLALFAAMLGLAAINRWRLGPALMSGDAGAVRHLRRSLALETGAALAIVVIVAVLGTLDPAA